MRRAAVLLVALGVLLLVPGTTASAEDSVRLSRTSSLVGEQLAMDLRVLAPVGATVELTPGTPSWAGVELVRIDSVTQAAQSDGVVWLISARVAPFLPGEVAFSPSVAIVQGNEATPREVPPVALKVIPSLEPDADLTLSPLPPPVGIDGAESPLLKPALALGAAAALVMLGVVAWLVTRRIRSWLRNRVGVSGVLELPRTLEGAEALLESDLVGAYRLMSSVVKSELARRYGVRATALTSTELRRKLEAGGDRWEARLVGGLLEECDSVIYAGYRPAPERRQHDLTMAREIVEVAS